jgi:hypothetical protein
MGGPGSGCRDHWWRPTKKTTVEQCLSLDISRFYWEGIVRPGNHHTGLWHWTRPGGKVYSITFEVNTLDLAAASLRLSYTLRHPSTGEQGEADYYVWLTTTRQRGGGLRWWFRCPLFWNGDPCGRRAGSCTCPQAAGTSGAGSATA